MGNSSSVNQAAAYVAWNTGNDKTGRIFLDGSKPRKNNDRVFQTIDAAAKALKKYTKPLKIYLYADIDNPPCNRTKRNFYYMSDDILNMNKSLLITTVDGRDPFFNPDNECGNLFTPNAFVYINNKFRIRLLTIRYANYTDGSGNYIMTETYSYKANYINYKSGDVIRGRPSNIKPLVNINEDVPLIRLEGNNYFEDCRFNLDYEEGFNTPKVIIENKGNILGEFPSFKFKNMKNDIIIVDNIAKASIDIDNNNAEVNSLIQSNKAVTIINTNNATKETRINMENCEFDLDIPESILLTNEKDTISNNLFNLKRCNFIQTNDVISLLTNTTNYKMIYGISDNVIIPTCSNMISTYTNKYNPKCTEVRPDATSKINGGTLANSTMIIPPKVIKENTIIEDIFKNDASIYLVDASEYDITITLPSRTLDGLYIIFKKIDKTCNKVKIVAPKGMNIDGYRSIHLKTRECRNDAIKLLYHNESYYIL